MAKRQRSLAAFFSYVQLNDKHDRGRLTELRERLEREVEVQTGEKFTIFQDKNDISWGQAWKERIDEAIDGSTFLIVIVTPGYFNSPPCRDEFDRFLKIEKKLKRNDLILPIYYVETPVITDEKKKQKDPIAIEISKHQWADWRDLRFEPWTTPEVGKRLAKMAVMIRDAIEKGSNTVTSKTTKTSRPKRTRKSKLKYDAKVLNDSPASSKLEMTEGDVTTGRKTARVDPHTVIVDPFPTRGDFQTLNEAIKAAKPGWRIIVQPGHYKESLIIEKPIEIIGDGNLEDIIIEAKNAHIIMFSTEFGRIANLTLRQTGGDNSYAIDIAQGRLELEGCDITSQALSCIGIHGGADPRLRRNRIHHSKHTGIIIYDNGKGTFEDNDIHSNGLSGVEIKTGSDPTLRRNRIHENKQAGVVVYENGKGTLEDNDIFSNGFSGVEIKTGGDPTVRRNRIHNSEYSGVYVHDNGKGTFEDNDIFSNDYRGVSIRTEGDPIVRRNRIHENKDPGVYIYEKGKGILEDNDIFGNISGGVKVQTGGNPTLRGNRIIDNHLQGIYVGEKGTGTFENNTLKGNKKGPWFIDPKAEKNIIRKNNIEQ